MRAHIFPAIKLSLCCMASFAIIYPLILLGIARVGAPNQGRGKTIEKGGRVVGYALVGQSFTNDNYFNSRPSAVSYHADGSGGSNKGPSNPDYLKDVSAKIDSFMAHNPGVKKSDIPAELVTASGSGLDPDISPKAADVQIGRIAKARGIGEDKLRALVESHTEQPFVGMPVIHVLQLNVALDKLTEK